MKRLSCILLVLCMATMAHANLLLHYSFDGDLDDSTGTYNGEAKGTAGNGSDVASSLDYVEGRFGQAANFSGDDWIWVNGGNPLDQLTTEVTIAFWTKMDAVQNQVEMVAGLDSSGGGRLAFVQLWYGTTYWDTTGNRAQAGIPAATSDGQWHHWAYTKNSTTGLQTIYFDGDVIGQSTDAFTPFADEVWGGLALGAHFQYGDTYTGGLDELMIYNNELDQTEVQALMIPEPATIGLFGISALFLKKRKK